jgi:lantibiotic modifying enzyme
MVRDAGICHGTAGIAHIFNRLYRTTKQYRFQEAANYWCLETLKMSKFEDGFAGYKTWHTEEYGGWQPCNNLLEGIAGIGLSLLSFVMPEDPAWDECLLLS